MLPVADIITLPSLVQPVEDWAATVSIIFFPAHASAGGLGVGELLLQEFTVAIKKTVDKSKNKLKLFFFILNGLYKNVHPFKKVASLSDSPRLVLKPNYKLR